LPTLLHDKSDLQEDLLWVTALSIRLDQRVYQ